MSRANDKALSAFMTNMGEIQAHLAALSRYVDNHMEVLPHEVHWGHVGDTGRVLEVLAEIYQFLNLPEIE
ncbi:MAG: hypothetical protein FWD99_10190 [Oscillospiraceae bacterium]|nr:hypothetical protein [Oscillospiraceae bacterium]